MPKKLLRRKPFRRIVETGVTIEIIMDRLGKMLVAAPVFVTCKCGDVYLVDTGSDESLVKLVLSQHLVCGGLKLRWW